jgi:CBS domain-containing protein
LESIVSHLLADDQQTFVCHKTLEKERMTCAGAVALMSKLGRLPVIARLGLAYGVITEDDIVASAAMVIDPSSLTLSSQDATN